ncbi:MAG: hypothetical protein JRJ29_10880 [Deltaproteobacteria bacterium]|nr:hypothetical protein [Deltaproteobacteria bacterium]
MADHSSLKSCFRFSRKALILLTGLCKNSRVRVTQATILPGLLIPGSSKLVAEIKDRFVGGNMSRGATFHRSGRE